MHERNYVLFDFMEKTTTTRSINCSLSKINVNQLLTFKVKVNQLFTFIINCSLSISVSKLGCQLLNNFFDSDLPKVPDPLADAPSTGHHCLFKNFIRDYEMYNA